MTTQAVQTKTFPCSSVIHFSSLHRRWIPRMSWTICEFSSRNCRSSRRREKWPWKRRKLRISLTPKAFYVTTWICCSRGFRETTWPQMTSEILLHLTPTFLLSQSSRSLVFSWPFLLTFFKTSAEREQEPARSAAAGERGKRQTPRSAGRQGLWNQEAEEESGTQPGAPGTVWPGRSARRHGRHQDHRTVQEDQGHVHWAGAGKAEDEAEQQPSQRSGERGLDGDGLTLDWTELNWIDAHLVELIQFDFIQLHFSMQSHCIVDLIIII